MNRLLLNLIFPSAILVSLMACEEVATTAAQDHYTVKRTEAQIREDSLFGVLRQTKDLSRGTSQSQMMGSLSVAEGGAPETGIPALITTLFRTDDDDRVSQTQLIQALGNTGSDLSVPALQHYLLKTSDFGSTEGASTNPTAILNASVRVQAAIGLGHSLQKSAIPSLIQSLQDSELSVRQASQKSLRHICNTENGYDPQENFEQRIVGQSQWSSWWEDNQDRSRETWLIQGFEDQDIEIDDLNSSENLVSLIESLKDPQKEYIRFNLLDVINTFKLKKQNELSELNQSLLDLMDSQTESVRRASLTSFIRFNKLTDITINQDGSFDSSKSINTISFDELDDVIAFVKNWWQNKKINN